MEGADRRLTTQLLHQWQMACDVSLPPLGLFKPAAAMGLWPNCMLVHVEREPEVAYKCEHMGSAILQTYGQDFTNAYLPTASVEFPGTVIFRKLDEVVAIQRPIEDEGEFTNKIGKVIKYRVCFLPYSEDTKTLTHILIGLSFREF